MKRILLLTGSPGVGKTTVLTKAAEVFRMKGVSVGGMISREVRENSVRVGFEILDLTSGKHGWLAHVNQQNGPIVGKYHVNLDDLDKIGATAVIEAIEKCDAIAIDEIGPMELFSQKFKQAARQALASRKHVLAVVHAKAKDPIITLALNRVDAEVFTVTVGTQETLPKELTSRF